MTGGKALHLEAQCRARRQAFLRFDFFAHGRSSGRFEDATLGRWAEDAVAVLDELTQGPQILVGSSMGGWVALLAALRRPERVRGLIGIAPAPDFTEDMILPQLGPALRQELEGNGVIYRPSAYSDEPYPMTLKLIEDARNHLVLRDTIPLDCPIRLLQGMKDPDVPWRTSLRIAEQVRSADVRLTLIKDGDHRLSREQDLALLSETLDELTRSATVIGGGAA
jgi:pimeloyl-ACP methyl ester carboxylesterase